MENDHKEMILSARESLAWIQSRRSVFPKSFEQGDVSREEIESLLEACRYAPTHKLTQPWRFVVFTGQAKGRLAEAQAVAFREQFGDGEQAILKTQKFTQNAEKSAAVLAIVMKRSLTEKLPEWEELCAVACAVQNLSLHASSLGLGGYWSSGAMCNAPGIRWLLKVGEKDVHMGWFYLGRYRGQNKAAQGRLSVGEFATFLSE